MNPGDASTITLYLKRLSSGDSSAETPLANAVYSHMQRIARGVVHIEAGQGSLQPTALVNEVLLELIRLRSIEWQDRAHFFRVASRALRRRFIDHIRGRRAAKRPPTKAQVELDDLLMPAEDRFEEIIFVNEGLEQLASFDPALSE